MLRNSIGIGILRPREVRAGHEKGDRHVAFPPPGDRLQREIEPLDSRVGERDQEIEIRLSGDVILPGAAPVQDDGDQIRPEDPPIIIGYLRKYLFRFFRYFRHMSTSLKIRGSPRRRRSIRRRSPRILRRRSPRSPPPPRLPPDPLIISRRIHGSIALPWRVPRRKKRAASRSSH